MWFGVTRWERATETFHHYTQADGLPSRGWAAAFSEDAAGNVWIGMGGTLVRYAAGRFRLFTAEEGLPSAAINALHLDHASRLWVATDAGGLSRVDNPIAERPSFVNYATANGLASNQIHVITEDRWGRIYAFTGRGLDRLDPTTGQSAYLDLNSDLIPGSTGRFSVRAVDPTCPGCGRPARGIIQTLEVIDNAMGRTELLYAPAQFLVPEGPPQRPAPFGMVGIIGGQTARLSVALPGDPISPPNPIRVILSFVKSNGQPVIWDGVPQQTEVTLQPGGSASFDLPAHRVLGSATRAQIRPVLLVPTCPGCRVIPTLEVIDHATSKTAVLYAPATTLACRED